MSTTPKQLSFQYMFTEWFELITESNDVQDFQDKEWEWIDEIQKFIDDPEKEYSYQIALQQEDDEKLNADREEEEKEEYFTNSFGIKMKRSKQWAMLTVG